MILQRYLAWRYLRSFLILGGVFLAILFLIDLIEQIRRLAGRGAGLSRAAELAMLNLPAGFYSIMPLVGLLAGIAMFLNMSRSSEMVAIRAAGRSGLRSVAAPAVTAALIGVVSVAVLNPIVAATQLHHDAVNASIGNDIGQTVSLGKGAVWLRQGLPLPAADRRQRTDGQERASGGQVVIRANRASPDAATLYDAMFLIFDPELRPIRRLEAKSARLESREWVLAGVKEWPLSAPNPEAGASIAPGLRLPTELTAASIRDGFGSPESVPIWKLPGFIAGLQRAGFLAQRHQVWLAMELARPLVMAAMVMIAAAFTMRPLRGRRAGVLVLCAFVAGVGLFFLRNLAQVMGETGAVPPDTAAFAPPLIAILLVLAMLLRLEDG